MRRVWSSISAVKGRWRWYWRDQRRLADCVRRNRSGRKKARSTKGSRGINVSIRGEKLGSTAGPRFRAALRFAETVQMSMAIAAMMESATLIQKFVLDGAAVRWRGMPHGGAVNLFKIRREGTQTTINMRIHESHGKSTSAAGVIEGGWTSGSSGWIP